MSKLDNWLQETVTIGKEKKRIKKEKKEEEKKKVNFWLLTLKNVCDLEEKIDAEKDEEKKKELKKEQEAEKDRATKMYATRGDVMKSGVQVGGTILLALINLGIPLAMYLGILGPRSKDPNNTQYMDDDRDKFSILRVFQKKLDSALK